MGFQRAGPSSEFRSPSSGRKPPNSRDFQQNDVAYVVVMFTDGEYGQDFCVRLGAMSTLVVPALLGAVVSRNPRKRVLFLALAVIGLVEQDEEEQEHAAQRPLLRLHDGRTFASPISFV